MFVRNIVFYHLVILLIILITEYVNILSIQMIQVYIFIQMQPLSLAGMVHFRYF